MGGRGRGRGERGGSRGGRGGVTGERTGGLTDWREWVCGACDCYLLGLGEHSDWCLGTVWEARYADL